MKTIAKYRGGSHSYGLATPESDEDIRHVFIHDELSKIIGLQRHDHENKMTDGDDIQGYELRHFLNLLRNGNTQCIEFLFNDTWIEQVDFIAQVQFERGYLISSDTVFKCLSGYSYSERKLIFPQAHMGKIGEKRRKAVENYGYSYRNAVHAFRLLRCGILFFKNDWYPINIVAEDKEYGRFLFELKTQPEKFEPKDLDKQLGELDKELKAAYEARVRHHVFNDEIANRICFDFYMPILKKFDY